MRHSNEVLRRADGVVISVVPGSDPVMRHVADLCYETLLRPFGAERNDNWNELDPLSTHFVALDGDTLVGYVRLIVEQGGGHVRQVAVVPSHRRRGIARDLVRVAVTRADELGLSFAFLNARVSAVGVYERIGFRVADGPFRMSRTYLPHVRMERVLR